MRPTFGWDDLLCVLSERPISAWEIVNLTCASQKLRLLLLLVLLVLSEFAYYFAEKWLFNTQKHNPTKLSGACLDEFAFKVTSKVGSNHVKDD